MESNTPISLEAKTPLAKRADKTSSVFSGANAVTYYSITIVALLTNHY